MKTQKIQKTSNEALPKQKISIGAITGFLAGLLTILLMVGIALWFKEGFATALPSLIIPFALSPIVFINLTNLNAIKKELQTRNEML